PAHADDQDAGALQRLLAGAADLGQNQLAGVALDFLVGKANRGGGGGRLGHARLSSAGARARQAGTDSTPTAVVSRASARAGLSWSRASPLSRRLAAGVSSARIMGQ